MMKGFSYFAPLRIIFETGAINKIGQVCARNGRRVLLVVGKNHLFRNGVIDVILDAFKRTEKIEEVEVFNETPQNPDSESVEKAKQLILSKQLDLVVAVGGGSAMDLAKAASICAKNNINFIDVYKHPRLPLLDAYPVVCSPTTSGSGSEVTKYAVINENSLKIKVAIGSEALFPRVSLIDPQLTYTMPKEVIANTGFDALSHAIEAFSSKSSSPITDAYCREAISIIGVHLPQAFNKNKESMDNMSLAAMFAGMALNVGRASLPHALEHALSAYNPSLPHGLGLSMVMPGFLKRAYRCNLEKFAQVAYLLGEDISNKKLDDAAKLCVDAVEKLKSKIGLNKNLKDFGFDKKTVDEMVENTLWTMEHGIKNSPCQFSVNEIKNIYYEALED